MTTARVGGAYVEALVEHDVAIRVAGAYVEAVVGNDPPPCPPPANDNIADAIVLVGDSGSVSGTTDCSTNEMDETWLPGDPSGSAGAGTVWYQWTPSVSGVLTITFTAGIIDTPPAATQLWSVRGAPSVDAPLLNGGPFWAVGGPDVVGGTTYWFQVGSPYGEFTFEWALVPTPPEPPPRDLMVRPTGGPFICGTRATS